MYLSLKSLDISVPDSWVSGNMSTIYSDPNMTFPMNSLEITIGDKIYKLKAYPYSMLAAFPSIGGVVAFLVIFSTINRFVHGYMFGNDLAVTM